MKLRIRSTLMIGVLAVTSAVSAETAPSKPPSSAVLETGNKSGTYIIKLKADAVQLQGIRPYAGENTLPAAELLHAWDSIFQAAPEVPALLTWAKDSGETGVRLWISKPSYDTQSGELRFETRRAWKTTDTLEALSVPKKSGLPLKPGDIPGMALYLDGGQGRVIRYKTEAGAEAS